MKKFIIAALLVPFACSVSFAQHSDVEFGYDDFTNPTTIIVESDELTEDGIQIVEGEFEGLGDEVFADSPGFITVATEDEGGERVNAGDEVSVKFLDASGNSKTGVGFVNFYDAETDQISSVGEVTITPQNGVAAVLDGTTVSNGNDIVLLSIGSDGSTMSNAPGEAPEVLGAGEIHNHLVFTLGEDAPGAYGLLFQFESTPADGGPVITSDPIWLILNNGLDDEVFEDQAVAAFVGDPILLGDVNGDDAVDFLDISPFIEVLSSSGFQCEADVDDSGEVDFLDISPFVGLLSGSAAE